MALKLSWKNIFHSRGYDCILVDGNSSYLQFYENAKSIHAEGSFAFLVQSLSDFEKRAPIDIPVMGKALKKFLEDSPAKTLIIHKTILSSLIKEDRVVSLLRLLQKKRKNIIIFDGVSLLDEISSSKDLRVKLLGPKEIEDALLFGERSEKIKAGIKNLLSPFVSPYETYKAYNQG